nr:DNA repair protein RecO [Kingella kingae]
MKQRINHQPVFVLSSKPWRETSLWLEVFSQNYGRVALLARSARTRGSELRGVLMPFVPISVSWFGKEELKTIHRAEWLGGWAQPKNRALFSAMYANELVLKLTAREDPNPAIYQALQQLMQQIAQATSHTAALRYFEWQLLNALGYAPDTQTDQHGNAIIADAYYLLRAEHAAQAIEPSQAVLSPDSCLIQGNVLHALQQSSLQPNQLNSALALNRVLIQHHIPHIASPQVLQQLAQLKNSL